MIKIVELNANTTLNDPELHRILNRNPAPDAQIEKTVKGILADIRTEGYAKALEYAQKFDGLTTPLRASVDEIKALALECDPEVQLAIRTAARKVREFHEHQKEKSWKFTGKQGEVLGQRIRPMKRVGLYVPGGAGVYPSTVIMNAVPALVAGVEEFVVVSPMAKGMHPSVAYALDYLGVAQEVYKIGGAQAVGLMAYGSRESQGMFIQGVDKIVGPANVYAALAKKEVFGTVDIDMIAGPSEILVIFDETADPDWVAADLLSQAEHGSGFEAAIGVTTSMQAAEWVKECVFEQVEKSPKKELLKTTLEQFGRIFVVESQDEMVRVSDLIAPEHLEIICQNADDLSEKIQNAGAIFVGPWSSEPVGDYFAGPNHVLPTCGTARFSNPLGVYDFYKRTSIIKYTQEAIQMHGAKIAALADAEGFVHHADAVRKRL